MTVTEYLVDMIVQRGLFESQAKEIIEIAIPEIEKSTPDYKISFDRPATEYPMVLYGVWFLTIKPIAYKWIEENVPQAWCKEMFA